MRLFRRRRVEMSADAYRRWLRAHRPPFDWFAALSELEQDALAGLGDDYIEHQIVVQSEAIETVQEPQQPQPSAEADDARSQALAAALQIAAQVEPDHGTASGAGFAKRRDENNGAAQRDKRAGKTFMGAKPATT